MERETGMGRLGTARQRVRKGKREKHLASASLTLERMAGTPGLQTQQMTIRVIRDLATEAIVKSAEANRIPWKARRYGVKQHGKRMVDMPEPSHQTT
jgi:hypothetical protein